MRDDRVAIPPPGAPGALPSGPGGAAILAAGAGAFALGVFAFAGDASPRVKALFNFWKPSGPLSGVSLAATLVWLFVWWGLASLWRRRDVNLGRVNVAAFILLAGGLLLTFPPFMDLLQGK